MAKLANKNHELFAQQIAAGIPHRQAYQAVYAWEKQRRWWMEAWHLYHRPQIQNRVEEIISAAASRLVVTIDTLNRKYEQAYAVAFEDRNPAAMVAATKAQAMMFGLDQPQAAKEERDQGVQKYELMTDQEKRFMWANMIADLRAVKAALDEQPKVVEHQP